MAYNRDRAVGCRIGYNAVIKAVKYIDSKERIPSDSSIYLRRVLKIIYGDELYTRYRRHRANRR